MELLGIKNFAVLYFTPETVRGARFERADKQWKLVCCSSVPIDNENPAAAWKSVLKDIERRDTLLLLTGALPDGVFFQFNSVELSSKEQRGAVELELSRHLMQIPGDRMFQFAAGHLLQTLGHDCHAIEEEREAAAKGKQRENIHAGTPFWSNQGKMRNILLYYIV